MSLNSFHDNLCFPMTLLKPVHYRETVVLVFKYWCHIVLINVPYTTIEMHCYWLPSSHVFISQWIFQTTNQTQYNIALNLCSIFLRNFKCCLKEDLCLIPTFADAGSVHHPDEGWAVLAVGWNAVLSGLEDVAIVFLHLQGAAETQVSSKQEYRNDKFL